MPVLREKRSVDELGNPSYELFILALALLSLFNLAALVVLQILSTGPQELLTIQIIDGVITGIFLIDFWKRYHQAPKGGRHYFLHERGWLDLLGSLPYLKIFRIFRVVRVLRQLRVYGFRPIIHWFLDNRAQGALYVVLTGVVFVLEFSALAIVPIESRSPSANITTGGDALWWGIVTMTTVGYGDKYPVTTGGRLIGVVVMVIGVGLFGTLSGFLANVFLAPRKPRDVDGEASAESDMKSRLADLHGLLDEQQRANETLRARLAEIEQLAH
jgi:ion transport protein